MLKGLLVTLALIGLVGVCVPPTRAQERYLGFVPLGFCALSSMSAATGLSSCSGGIPTGATYIVACAYVAGIVWRDDGTNPTGTPGSGGQGIAANSCLPYWGTPSAMKFIQQSTGALLGVSFYR